MSSEKIEKIEQKYTAHLPGNKAIPGLTMDQALQVIAQFEPGKQQFTGEYLATVGHYVVRFMWVDTAAPAPTEQVVSVDQIGELHDEAISKVLSEALAAGSGMLHVAHKPIPMIQTSWHENDLIHGEHAQSQDGRERMPIGLVAPPPPRPQGPRPGDDRILWGVVSNAGAFSQRRAQRWAHVMLAAGIGSTQAIDLCRRFNFDPEEIVGQFAGDPNA